MNVSCFGLVVISVLVTLFVSPEAMVIRPGDNIDNDGDGLIDEEYCYNGIDEDGDGQFNEDCAALATCERRGSTNGLEFVGSFMENRPDRPLYVPLEMVVTRAIPKGAYGMPPRPDIALTFQTPRLLSEASFNNQLLPGTSNLSFSIPSSEKGRKFPLPDMLRVVESQKSDKGYYIRANSTVSVYGFNKEFYTSDAFLNFPADSLGTEYFAVTYEPSLLYTELAIVALYSDTRVTVTLLEDLGDTDVPRIEVQWDGRTYTNGDTIRIRLQPYQVAQLQAERDLTGTRVQSDLPVAFFSGNVRTWIRDDLRETEVQSRDHLVEQLPPTDTWGTTFVSQNYPPHTGEDRLIVVASQDYTVVTMTNITRFHDGTEAVEVSDFTLIRPGTFRSLRLIPRSRVSLSSTKPIMVSQMTHSQMYDDVPVREFSDPSLIYIVPVNQFHNDYFFSTSDNVGDGNFTTYVVMACKQGYESFIELNGNPLPYQPNWQSIPIHRSQFGRPTDRYVQGYIQVSNGIHRLRITQGTFAAVHWAVGDRNTIGYPLGIRWKEEECQMCQQIICGDQVDNDCDGRIDEEPCRNGDFDQDGRIDEDCYCDRASSAPSTTKTTTTTTAMTTTTTRHEVPGLCTLSSSGHSLSTAAVKVNLIFAVDWTTSRLPTTNQFEYTSQFLKEAIRNWFSSSLYVEAKFGIVSFANGVPSFLQYLTTARGLAIASVSRNYRRDMILNTRSDMTQMLRFVRSHMFTPAANADSDAKKIVVALAFSRYTSNSLISSIRFETAMLGSDYDATTYFVGLQRTIGDVYKLSMANRHVSSIAGYSELINMTPDNSEFVNSFGVSSHNTIVPSYVGPSFRSEKVCFGSTVSLSCPAGQQIVLTAANYGRINYFGEHSCGIYNPLLCDASNPACPYLDAYETFVPACNMKQSCSVSLNANFLYNQVNRLPSTCTRDATYVDINYLCIDLPDLTACSFTPASRLLENTNEFQLSASSSASCPSCDRSDSSLVPGHCDASNFCTSSNDQCRPSMATFAHSALEAWCPSLSDTSRPWLTADLGAPYVILGLMLQGRRRLVSQFSINVNVYISNDNQQFNRIPTRSARTTFPGNSNSTQVTWVDFETAAHIARYVKVEVARAAQHPALHLEVIVHRRVNGCDSFRGSQTDLQGKRGTMGSGDLTVNCLHGTLTNEGYSWYVTKCQMNGRWSVEKSCA